MKRDWYSRLRNRWLADPRTRAEYEALAPKYDLISEYIGARARARLSQAQLAKRMGTSQSAIARIESGNRLPSLRTLMRYAEATGTRVAIKLVPLKAPAAAARRRRKASA